MGTKAWYVSQTGTDSGPGTESSPFRTIGKAASVVGAGETVYVRAGAYNEIVTMGRSGTATMPIAFVNYGGELVAVDGGGLNPGEGLFNILGAYVTLQGIVVQNSSKHGIENVGHHNTVRNCFVQDCQRVGLMTGDRGLNVENDYNVYDGNEIRRCVLNNTNNAWGLAHGGGGWDSAINNYRGGNGGYGHNLYTNNYVHDNWGEGTTVTEDDVFRSNRFADNWSVNIYLDGAQRVTVERNLCWATEGTPYIAAGRRSIGVGFADELSPARLSDCVVRNNMILNCSSGINFWNAGVSGSGLRNCKMFNNTIVNTVGTGVDIGAGTHTGAELRNNIVWPRAGNAVASATVTASNNIVKGVNTDPGMAGEGSSTDFDSWHYKIPAGSSARDAGASVAVTDDFFGTARAGHGTIDIGAHEY